MWTSDLKYVLPPEVFGVADTAQRNYRSCDRRGERLQSWKAGLGREPSGLEILEKIGDIALGFNGEPVRTTTAPRAPQGAQAQENRKMGTQTASTPRAQTRREIMAAREKAICSWAAQYEAQGRDTTTARRMAINTVENDYAVPDGLRLMADFIRSAYQGYKDEGKDPATARRMAINMYKGDFGTMSAEDAESLRELRDEGFDL